MSGWSEAVGLKETRLFEAAFRADASGIQDALKSGANTSARDGDGCSAMHALGSRCNSARGRAALVGDLERCVGVLCEAGIGLNEKSMNLGLTPTMCAVLRRDEEMVGVFAKAGADLSGTLMLAAQSLNSENTHLFALLIRCGADTREVSLSGKTLLEVAQNAWTRNPELEALLEAMELKDSIRKEAGKASLAPRL